MTGFFKDMGRGLQILAPRFDSGRGLQILPCKIRHFHSSRTLGARQSRPGRTINAGYMLAGVLQIGTGGVS